MNEYETNPQRHEAPSHEEPSHRSADAPRDSTSAERGQAGTTAEDFSANELMLKFFAAHPQP